MEPLRTLKNHKLRCIGGWVQCLGSLPYLGMTGGCKGIRQVRSASHERGNLVLLLLLVGCQLGGYPRSQGDEEGGVV